MRADTLARLAADTIALLERDGIQAFDRFAKTNSRPLRHEGTPYQGGNCIALWSTAALRGYRSQHWMTFQQALEYGACVRKGERSTVVVKVGRVQKETPAGEIEGFAFARAYPVFNADQIDGLPPQFQPNIAPGVIPRSVDRLPVVDNFLDSTGAVLEHKTNGPPCYVPSQDKILMPPPELFLDATAYYATLLHELVHWSGKAGRSERTKGKRFGDPAYALEELVAELGSAMLCGDLGLCASPREDHAHYLASWLRALKGDPMNLWTAGKAAEAACVFLHGLQRGDLQAAA